MNAQPETLHNALFRSARADFPLLQERDVVFLDSAASAQKPQAVLAAMLSLYERHYANIHRGVYDLSIEATEQYDAARKTVAQFIGAHPDEIIFTRNATESINLVAHSWTQTNLKPGDEILVTLLEHHSNIVPWQLAAERHGAAVRFVSLTSEGQIDLDSFQAMLNPATKLVAVTHLANALGVVPPVAEIIRIAHAQGAKVLVDGAQAVAHLPVDVAALDADFYVFSGHRLYGPTGIGVLYGKKELLRTMPPFMGGGDMIRTVTINGSDYADVPQRFEAGTPHIAGAVGLAAAIEYVCNIGIETIAEHEAGLVAQALGQLSEIPQIRILGPAESLTGLICFVVQGIHPHDVAQFLSQRSIAVRAGHHCAQPLLTHLGIPASTRISFGLYNTEADVDCCIEALKDTIAFFR